MSQLLAARIRHHLTPPGYFPGPSPTAGVLAVLDKCEQMRAEADRTLGNSLWASAIADEFEQAIATALGIEP